MSECLTPEEVEQWAYELRMMREGQLDKKAATLRAYAQVVEAVAEEAKPYVSRECYWQSGDVFDVCHCPICGCIWDKGSSEIHDDCYGSLARKLRGHADQGGPEDGGAS